MFSKFVHFSKSKTFNYFLENCGKKKKKRLQNNSLQYSQGDELNCPLQFQIPCISTWDVQYHIIKYAQSFFRI